jgi:DHA3 family macrolide efflux protein-like MFS transporter
VRSPAYRSVLSNRSFVALWLGQGTSTFGDALFNVAIVWTVYSRTGSILATATVQILTHVSAALVGMIAGVYADIWDRRRIIVLSNICAAVVVGAVVCFIPSWSTTSVFVVFTAVLLLTAVTTWASPARASLLPEVVGAEYMAVASGLYSMASQGAAFVGTALAGIIIALVGAVWAVVGDALSFVAMALAACLVRIAPRTLDTTAARNRRLFGQELKNGLGVVWGSRVLRGLIGLTVLINVAWYIGPIWPALVRVQLHGGSAAYGALEAVAVAGGQASGALAGELERRLGAGQVIVGGWLVAGIATVGIALSHSLTITAALEVAQVFGLVTGSVASGALSIVLVSDEYRGRVSGMSGALGVVMIPASALVGGLLADRFGPGPLVAAGGVWIVCVALLAWLNEDVRGARLPSAPATVAQAGG